MVYGYDFFDFDGFDFSNEYSYFLFTLEQRRAGNVVLVDYYLIFIPFLLFSFLALSSFHHFYSPCLFYLFPRGRIRKKGGKGGKGEGSGEEKKGVGGIITLLCK